MGNSPICWRSKKQSIVATSTTEAEYIATSECVKKGTLDKKYPKRIT